VAVERLKDVTLVGNLIGEHGRLMNTLTRLELEGRPDLDGWVPRDGYDFLRSCDLDICP